MLAINQVISLNDGYITFGFGQRIAKYSFTTKEQHPFWGEERYFKVEMYYSKPQSLFLIAISLHMFLVIESKDTQNHQTTQSSVVAVRKRLSSTERSTTQAETSATPAERRRIESISTTRASTTSTQRTTAAQPTRRPSQTLSLNNGSNRQLMMTSK